ncbi:hypothetical protein [Duganella aquatilis]|nr:hypothetical protein [Duganella aquatilis]
MRTSDHVLEILTKEGGYRQLPKPFKVGTLPFEFTHALVGTDRANDLVIVIDLNDNNFDEMATRKVMALTRALDVIGSKRPVTAVLTSGNPHSKTVQAISKVSRVLPIGSPVGPNAVNSIREWLSVLLPLVQQSSIEAMLNWATDLSVATPALTGNEFMKSVVDAALHGKAAVETVLADSITSSIDTALSDKGDKT